MYLFILTIFVTNVNAKWSISKNKDEMTGESSVYVFSNNVYSTKKMYSPYNKTSSVIGIGCDKDDAWIYVSFSAPPNLNDKVTKNGYNLIITRVKFNDEIKDVAMTQDWGSKVIHFKEDDYIIRKIKDSNTMLLELNWYGNDKVYFKYNLAGSTKAINKAFKKCKYNAPKNVSIYEECEKSGGKLEWVRDDFYCIKY